MSSKTFIFTAKFEPGSRVMIDEDSTVKGCVTQIAFQAPDRIITYATYQVEWLHNGANQSAWFPGWRLQNHPSVK